MWIKHAQIDDVHFNEHLEFNAWKMKLKLKQLLGFENRKTFYYTTAW